MTNIPRISVLVITYKQEKLIKRALNSLISQKDYIYEICVSDDCSPDRTWDVLQDYKQESPDLFKLNRNDPNVGIFENIEKSWTMATGDIVYALSGDDECGEGWLKKVVDYICDNKIDYKNELFCIYGDYKCVYPNGDTFIYQNSAISVNNCAMRLGLRQIICNRSACCSINVIKQFEKVSQGKSHIPENVQDRMLQLFSKQNYYIPCVGNIYYSNIGISAHLSDEMINERLSIWPYTMQWLDQKGISLCKKDVYYVKSRIAFQQYVHFGKKTQLLVWLWYVLMSFDPTIKGGNDTLRKWKFAFMRRVPHHKILNFD